MNEKQIGGNKRRKALSAILAIAMIATMLLSGTLAYYYRTKATNTLRSAKKEVVGHDDFVVAKDGMSYNKDVYVENIGETNVYVRVQLQEDFTLNGKKIVDTLTHIPAKTADGNTNVTIGTATGDSNSGDNDIHKYFTWTMGNVENGAKYYRSAEDPILLEDNVAKDNTGTKYVANTDFVRKTAYGPVITLTAYKKLAENPDAELGANIQKSFVGWVVDETTGWAYWSQMLKPGETTGMLLDAVTATNYAKTALAGAEYEYNIHVNFESVDETDLKLWKDENENTDASGKLYAAGEISKIPAASDVNTLLANAKEMSENVKYSQYTIAARNQCYEAISASNSPAAKLIYQHALTEALDAWQTPQYPLSSLRITETAQLLCEIGKNVDQLNPATKNDVIAKKVGDKYYISKDGTALGSTLPAADTTGIGPFLFANEVNMDNNDIITREEAAALTFFTVAKNDPNGDSRGVKSVNSLTEASFPNLFWLQLTDTGITSVDFTNMSKKIRGIRLQNNNAKATTQEELSKLPDLSVIGMGDLETLCDLILVGYNFRCDENLPLTNLNYLSIRNATCSGKLNFESTRLNRAYLRLDAAAYFTGTLDLRTASELELFDLRGGFAGDGTVDVSQCKHLVDLNLYYGEKYGCNAKITAKVNEACKGNLGLVTEGDVSVHYVSSSIK